MNQGALHFDALLSVNNFDQGITRIKNSIREASGVAQKEAQVMDSAFRNLGTAIGGYFTAQSLFSFTKELINVRGEFQKTEIAFSTMLGSGDKAKVLMGQMVDLAAKTPFSLKDVSVGAKQLLAFQVPAKDLLETLTRIGNISAGVSVPIDRIILAYGQVKAAGRLMGTEMRQFTEAGIPMYAELAKVLKTDETAIKGMIEAGKVGFKDVEQVIKNLTSEGGMFFELMEKQSTSMSGRVSNLGDQWDQMLNKIGQANEGILYDGIEGLTHLVEHYQELFEMIKTLVLSYGAYKAAIMVTSAAQSLANKTLATEIGYLSFSQRMKLGRAIITQRQTAATLADAQAEKASLSAKYATLQAEISILAVKKQKAVALGIEKTQAVGNAQVQLALAQSELRAVQASGTAREVLIATKNVEKAQNTVIAAQESASIARKAALAAGTKFYTAQKGLETAATALSAAAVTVETAEEVANAAAKTANTIATQRLTVAQLAQTVAMTAAARAAAFLNATLFANPYALATALIVALGYAIYKYNSALTVAEESQKRMNEDAANQISTITEQEAKIKSLIKVIEDKNSSEDESSAAVKRLHLLTNGRLDQLDAEAVKTGKATGMIQKYIEMLKLEAEAKRYVNELGRLETDTENLKNTRSDFGIGDMWDDFTDFDSSFQWSLKERKKERVDRIVKDKEAEKKEIQKKLDDLAKRGVNISETEINEDKSPAKKGWAAKIKAQIDELESQLDSAPTQAAYNKIKAKIKVLNDLLNPKKEKQEGQIAEILPLGSIKELQQRASLISDAIDVAINGQVRLRKLDKFGKDKDKKGNPFYTGEIISLEESYKRRESIEIQITKLQYKSFQERIDEAERQWNNYYKMSEYYGKETSDAQYKELFNGAQNYLDYLEKQEQTLRDKQSSGILTEQEKKDILFLQQKISELNGTETPFENFKRGIDDALKALPSLVDQIDFLSEAESNAYDKAGGNTDFFLKQRKYLQDKNRDAVQQEKELYTSFLQEQQTFEEKKTQIQSKYEDFRKKISKGNFSDTERLRLLDSAGKAEAKEYREAFMSVFEKTDLFEKAFGNIDALTKKEISQLLPQLEKKMQELIDLGAPTAEVEVFRKKIEDLKTLTSGNSPFKSLIASFKELRKRIREGTATQEDFNRLNQHIQETKFYTDLAVNSAKELSEALGMDGKGGPFEKFAKDLTQTLEGLVNALVGYFSGNVQQMVGGIAQMVVGVVKMLSTAGDGQKEKGIRAWKQAVDDLKFAYEELQLMIEKTAGEGQITMQRELIANLKEQQRILADMRSKEASKKKADQDKISGYTQQIADINIQIQKIIDDFQKSITTSDFKDLSQKIADALIDAFGKGEDAAASFEKVVDDVMRNAVANALKIKILEPAVKDMVDNLYKSMGFGGNSGATIEQSELLQNYQNQIDDIDKKLPNVNAITASNLTSLKNDLLEKIKILKQQIAANSMSGSFDGLTKEERDKIKELGLSAMNQYTSALQQYEDLFGAASENAQGLKGDIKGITEKTAGALEGQFNAVRINVVEILKIHQVNQNVFKNQLLTLSQIEVNTRNLVQIRKDISEMNSKIKPGLAGIP
ncbi:tape measure protein [Chryseobacterium sp. SSA4.19]|uniref:tape measure protein n=1 Tax=Chryseobacterium sp. SSA4.19 TaxID=2919915 RepID=UPI001F4D44DE|nr:tape measure protein [Chryseobacterium sp. SSA4.19]MCJ8153250.1 tape measure protein [Chryseobacterium sp. SSA4.19]